MATFFEIAVLKLQQLGFFKFLLPFILTAAIIYGLLRRSQLFGDPDKNIAVNGTIAFVISLFVWAAPIILGIDIERNLAAFWIQGLTVSLVVIVGLLLAGMVFPPDLAKNLGERVKAGWFWGAITIIGILVGGVLLVTSGLSSVLFPKSITTFAIPPDLLITAGTIIVLGVVITFIIRAAK